MISLNPDTRIAVIGGGVAGITSSYLLDAQCQVTLYEKNDYVGGHTHTHEITDGPDKGARIDSGFIVMNNRTYPLLTKFLQRLGVAIRDSDMSFGYWDLASGLQYSGNGIGGLLAQPKNVFSGSWWRMIRDVLRFEKAGFEALAKGTFTTEPLGKFLEHHKLSADFRDHYLVPMGASIWSTSNEEMLEFPTGTFLEFFKNHGLLNLRDRPQWQTVVGGSNSYVKAFLKQFKGQVQTMAQISKVVRNEQGVQIVHADGRVDHHDYVIFAVHADEVLPLLAEANAQEKAAFSVWNYQKNDAVLHTHAAVLPPQKRAWASWNFTREESTGERQKNPVSITYDMVRLQGVQTQKHWLVSLNRVQELPASSVYKKMLYYHPTFTAQSVASREQILSLCGTQRSFFVGSYFGYGFHEDAVKSSVTRIHDHFGIDL